MEPDHKPETTSIKFPVHQYQSEMKGITESLPDVIFRLDINLRFIYTNTAIQKIFNIQPDVIYGKTLRGLDIPNDIIRNFEDSCQKVIETKKPHLAEGYILMPGGPRYYETRYEPELTCNGELTGILCISRDISNRKLVEEDLKRRLDLERSLVAISARFVQPENIDVAIQQTLGDLGRLTGADHAYLFSLYADDTLLKMTHEWCTPGREPLQPRIQTMPAVMPWYMQQLRAGEIVIIQDIDQLPPEAQPVKEMLEKGQVKKQLLFPVFCASIMIGFIGLDDFYTTPAWRQDDLNTLQIIAHIIGKAFQQKQAEEFLKTQGTLLQQVIDIHPSSISLRNREGRFVLANKAMADDLGMTVGDIIGRHISEIPVLTNNAQRYIQEDLQVMNTLQELNNPEESDMRPSDQTRWWHTIKRPIIQQNGKADQVLGVYIDITTRKLAELESMNYRDQLENLVADRTAELTHLNKQLQQEIIERQRFEQGLNDSIAEKDTLLREIHHRVKNNLQIISSLLDLQSRDIQDPHAIQAFQDSQLRIKAIGQVHEQLYQSEDLARVDFTWYIKNTASSLFSTYGGRVKGISFVVSAEDVTLPVDTAIPLGLIISELISNSLKHGFPKPKEGSEIQVKLWLEDKDHYSLLVHDNGVGFPPELNWQNPSTLGLKLVTILTRQLRGTITLDSSQGTAFTVTFPPTFKQASRKP